ncbi:hypothetical protein EV363DRAFT_1185180 [Boletus edulis]|nr:hypothetical protein EV363DRAFT_1185180 [Boletus edulis]
MDSIILPGQYVLSIPTAVGTYYLGPLQDNPYTIGILPEDFTLINDGGVDEYKILTKGLCVDKMRDGSLCLKADDGHCENVSSGNETYMSVLFLIVADKGILTCLQDQKGKLFLLGFAAVSDTPTGQRVHYMESYVISDIHVQQAGFPILDGSQCCGMLGKSPCEMGDEKTTTSGGNTACTVCPPSCTAIKFVPV